MKTNSIIYKDPEERQVFDLSSVGTIFMTGESLIEIHQERHKLRIGDVIYYDIIEKKFDMAIAQNTIESEACGIVNQVVDEDNFTFIPKGLFETDLYSFTPGSVVYLSGSVHGKLTSIRPDNVVKEIGIIVPNGIMINIQRGFRARISDNLEELEPYTEEELQEIIKNIW